MSVSDLRFYVWLVLRRIHYFIAAVVVCSAVGVAIALNTTPIYRATAKILLESPQIPAELARTTVLDTAIEQIQIIEQEIKTRDYLLSLAPRLQVYPEGTAGMSDSDIVDDLRDRLRFEQAPLFAGGGGSGVAVFVISFDSPDSELSAKVVNDVVSFVLSKNARSRAGQATKTMQFFEEESLRLGEQLSGVEGRILAFKNAHSGSLPDSLEFRRTQQASVQERLVGLYREESALRSRKLNLAKLSELGVAPSGSAVVSPEHQTLADLNKALSMQLAVFSETSPTIVALKSQIAALKAQLAASDAVGKGDGSQSGTPIEAELVEINHRLESIENERISAETELAALTASIEATPASEATLTALLRNRDNIQAQYNAAIAKLAEASMGERIEVGSQGTRFSVVEAAVAPQYPIGPKRRLFALAGVGAGAALGAAIIVLLEVLNNSLHRPTDIVRLLEAPPLATIAFIERPGKRPFARRFRRLAASVALACCLLTPFGDWARQDGRHSPTIRHTAYDHHAAAISDLCS